MNGCSGEVRQRSHKQNPVGDPKTKFKTDQESRQSSSIRRQAGRTQNFLLRGAKVTHSKQSEVEAKIQNRQGLREKSGSTIKSQS